MARIRTIKPDFWRDESLATISPEACLLAIGLLNHCDDDGYFNANPKLVESDIFPLRTLSKPTTELLRELCSIGYLLMYKGNDNKTYGLVKNFYKHQVINKRTPSKIKGLCEVIELSGSPTVVLPTGMEWNGNRSGSGSGEEMELRDDLTINELLTDEPIIKNPSKPKIPNCQYQAVIDIYNETLPELPRAVALNTKREKLIKARWNWLFTSKKQNKEPRALNAEQALDWFREFFLCAKEDDFLMGRTTRRAGFETWTCSIDYLLEDRCLTKILEKTQG